MSVIYLQKVLDARAARNLAESMSPDPKVRAAARRRARAETHRREVRRLQQEPAEVLVLEDELYRRLDDDPVEKARFLDSLPITLVPEDY
jgi:hypothetical protein